MLLHTVGGLFRLNSDTCVWKKKLFNLAVCSLFLSRSTCNSTVWCTRNYDDNGTWRDPKAFSCIILLYSE